MHRKALSSILRAAVLCAAAASTSACEVAAYPDGGYVEADYPPPDFVATVQPVYYEGHAAYWYNGRWFYRDGGHWAHYDREPAALAPRRAQFNAGARVNYARPSARSVGRPGRR